MADAVVKAAALVAQLEAGGEAYFYQGEALAGVSDEEVKRLTEIGLVGEAKDAEAPNPTDPVTRPPAPAKKATARQ